MTPQCHQARQTVASDVIATGDERRGHQPTRSGPRPAGTEPKCDVGSFERQLDDP